MQNFSHLLHGNIFKFGLNERDWQNVRSSTENCPYLENGDRVGPWLLLITKIGSGIRPFRLNKNHPLWMTFTVSDKQYGRPHPSDSWASSFCLQCLFVCFIFCALCVRFCAGLVCFVLLKPWRNEVFTRESSYCFQRVLAIAILSVCLSVCPFVRLSVCHTGGSDKNTAR